MLIPNHPDDERLSALAARDDDAVADASLASHLSACTRCTDLVTELGALRASLAELPDLAPHRPLQLLPPVADASATAGAAGWVRRLFAPALTAGAAIAMVGLVGTAGPLVSGAASGTAVFQNVGSNLQEAAQDPASSFSALSTDASDGATTGGGEPAAAEESARAYRPSNEEPRASDAHGFEQDDERDALTGLPAERSIWPMVLFSGIALMVAAALLRWILVPRAG